MLFIKRSCLVLYQEKEGNMKKTTILRSLGAIGGVISGASNHDDPVVNTADGASSPTSKGNSTTAHPENQSQSAQEDLMVYARSLEALQDLAIAFEKGNISKELFYLLDRIFEKNPGELEKLRKLESDRDCSIVVSSGYAVTTLMDGKQHLFVDREEALEFMRKNPKSNLALVVVNTKYKDKKQVDIQLASPEEIEKFEKGGEKPLTLN